jgi:manganese/zinc/iron transport system permease protein
MNWLIVDWYWPLDGWIVLAGILCAVSAALLGNFLVLRKMSLLGDAISHAVLPGLAVAFLVTGSRNSLPMFVGAVVVGILTALFTQWIRSAGNVDEGASMGVVFTTLFALGLILIVQTADRVDLDPGCVLYGAIEFTPLDVIDLWGLAVPRVIITLSIVLLINLLFVVGLFKELRIASFDPELATALGFRASIIHYLLMTLVAVTAVAAFESVGNILVVAMFVVPPAAALMITDRLGRMVVYSAIIAAVGAASGHVMAISVPAWFGFRSTSTAGMMSVSVGLLFLVAALVGPKHGVLVTWARRWLTSWRILSEDIVAFLFRHEERSTEVSADFKSICASLMVPAWKARVALWREARRGTVIKLAEGIFRLTPAGTRKAQELVRSHRLWESYLVQELALTSDRIHDKAERLEHFTNKDLRTRLSDAVTASEDPHGSPIPPEAQ